MDNYGVDASRTPPACFEEEYASQSILLQEFSNVSNIEQAWTIKSTTGIFFGLVLQCVLLICFTNMLLFFQIGQFFLCNYLSVETFKSGDSQAMFLISQPNLLGNKKRKHILSSNISRDSTSTVSFQWSPFPIEVAGASVISPSPSGSKLFVIRNNDNQSQTTFEIWSSSQLEKEFYISQSIHGSVYADGW